MPKYEKVQGEIMLPVNIENPEIENKFRKFAKENKRELQDLINDALKMYLDIHYHEITYEKKDPMKNLHKIDYIDDGEDLSDVNLYADVEDSGKYIHELRRIKR